MLKKTYALIFFAGILFPQFTFSQQVVTGFVTNQGGRKIQGVNVFIDKNRGTITDAGGNYLIITDENKSATIHFSHIGYETNSKEIPGAGFSDTVYLNVVLKDSIINLPQFSVSGRPKPDTVFASVVYHVSDFHFYKDKLVLLAYQTRPEKDPVILLTDLNSNILYSQKPGFIPKELFKDYQDAIYIEANDSVGEIDINRNEFSLLPVNRSEYFLVIKPCIDSLGGNIILSDYSPAFPEFNYYSFSTRSGKMKPFKNIIDKPLMREYRYEYYFLPSKEKLRARRLAAEYSMDKHVVAAAMTGFQNSFYYTPLYAPLFLVNDTVMVFDHYENKLFFYNDYFTAFDSTDISYHRSKNEKWERKLIKDEQKDNIYSLYSKNGFYYLKKIDTVRGTTVSSFKLSQKYVDKIKISNDYVYYIYRPYESLQKKFLYKELIQAY